MKKPLSFNHRFLTGLSLIILLFFLGAPCLADVSYTFQWNPNHADDNVVTYRFYWSTTSGDYSVVNRDAIPNVVSGNFDPAAPQYIKTFPDPPPGEYMDPMYFVVSAVDDQEFESVYSLEIDTAAPQVTSLPTVLSVTESSATIFWTTDKPGTSIVEYGATSAYGSTAPVPASTQYVTDHLVTISGLASSTTYHFRASAVSAQGIGPNNDLNDGNPSADYTFTTAGAGQSDTTPPVIINIPGANSVTDTTATITWTTDEPSDSVVQYGLTTNYGSSRTLDTDVVSHSVQIQGLGADTTYQFRVRSTDIAGNGPTNSANYSFTTEPAPDTTMPVITSTPTATSVTDTTATIVWTTNEPATSVVEFGETASYTRSSSLGSYVTNHSVTLTLLKDATLYHFRVGSTDAAGNGPRNSTDSTFTTDETPDTQAPVVISPPTVIGTTDTTATIVWQTDETGNSQVRFDTVTGAWETLGTTFTSAAMVTQHSVTLTGLIINQTYYFRVGSTDTAGNGPDPAYTTDNNPTNTALNFTTKPDSTSPVVTSAPTVTGVTDSTVTIAWDTDEPSNSQVRYDTVSRTWATYTKTKTDAGMVTHHTVTITGLLNDQPYFFRVGSTDLGGNGPDPATTGDNNPTNTELGFTTQPDSTPPTITSPPTVTGISESTATIAWSTDEPSNSRVQYGTAGATWDGYPFSQNTADMVTNHVVTLSGLDPSTPYFFRVGSTDIKGNGPTVSTEVTFTTGAIEDVTPPQFDSPPTVTAKTHNSAIVNWTTNEPSNSEVQFDVVSQLSWGSYASNVTDSDIVTTHSITITSLSGSTLYYVRVGSSDLSGNVATSSQISFTTDENPDTEPPQVVLPPTVTIKTNATATIEWTTDEESNSQVRYGTQSSVWSNYPLTRSDATMVTNHSLTLTNLTGDTAYYFRVGSTDASGNGPATSNEVVFVTVPDPDITAPQFTSPPTPTAKTNNAATIAWSTDEPGNSQVQYGDNAATWGSYDFAENDAEMVSFHTVSISGLDGNTLYYFRVATTDAAGNGPSISSEITFRTDEDPDVTAPRITSPPTVTDKTVGTATIEWETDEPCNNEVRYDINSLEWETYRYIENDSDMVTSHSVTITGLDLLSDCESGGCRIFFMVGSTDAAGNGPDPDGIDVNNPFSEDTFTTELELDDNAPVVISGPIVTAVDSETAIIEWETDEPSNSIVKYGLDSATWPTYTHSEDDAALVTQHSVTLTNLNDFVVYETEYVDVYDEDGNVIGQEEVIVAVPVCAQGDCTFYYQIGSTDALGNGPTLNQSATNPSAENDFTTTESPDDAAPVVSDVNVAWVTNKTALITWQTDEPGNSQVRYNILSPATWETYAGSENDPDMRMIHSLTVTDLQASKLYYFQVGSTDAKGNGPDPSIVGQFTTADGPDESAPQISNFFVQPTSGETAVATWTTDEPGNSQVRYDTQSHLWEEYAFSENDAGMTTQHRVTLTRLSPSTLYYVRVSSTDASGNNSATSSNDVNPSMERNLTTTTEDPPSIVEYPEAKYPRVDATANTIEITYDELNMQMAESEGNYILSPVLSFASPGNSIDLVSTAVGQSTYRLSFVSVEAYTVYSLTVGDEITDVDGYRVQPNTVLINDNDADDLPDDWEIEFGLDPTSGDTTAGQGRDGDFDN
ncbi:fibronectin type III domain-containing protein, partial [Thermodesulfobacteriota bacterium]